MFTQILVNALFLIHRFAYMVKLTRVRRYQFASRIIKKCFRQYDVCVVMTNPARIGTLKLTLNLADKTHLVLFTLRHNYEREAFDEILAGIDEIDVFIDVGAHVGIFSLALASAFPKLKVIAVEPNPESFSRLREHVAQNALNNVEVLNRAVSSRSGTRAFLSVPEGQSGGGYLQLKEGGATSNGFWVETITLDEIVRANSCLKLDVEGEEVRALESAQEALSKALIVRMIVEVSNDSLDSVSNLLKRWHYAVRSIGPEARRVSGNQWRGNVLATIEASKS